MNVEPPPPSAASQSTPRFAKYPSKEGIGVITNRVITQGICLGLRLQKLQILQEITYNGRINTNSFMEDPQRSASGATNVT